MKCILRTDERPKYFFGDENGVKLFIGWNYYDDFGNKLATITNISYDPDEFYRQTDAHYGNAYKCLLDNGDIIPFRHINTTLEVLGAHMLQEPRSNN